MELALVSVLVVAGKPLVGVGDVDASVHGALHRTENLGAGGGAGEADIEARVERGPLALVLYKEVVSVDLERAGVQLVQLVLGQQPPGKQESCAVCSRVVGEADLDSVLGQLGGVGGANTLITLPC